MLFFGEYEHTIDAKSRLAIPAEVRDVIDREQIGPALVVAPGTNGSLWMWPEKTFSKIAQAFGGSLLPNAKVAQFERALFSQAARLELDSAGRIRLPDRHLKRFGLAGQVVILGVGQHLELMDVDSWRQQSEADAAMTPDIWEQARQHMEGTMSQ
ncbi:MAG: hypothetical protein KDA22_16545 [Phycisphaerales bacterium]|nr:hypothetical protein [Phycisphaerales bacterium]